MSKRLPLILITSITFCLSVKAQANDTLVYYIKIFRVSETANFEQVVKIEDKDSADFFRAVLPRDSTDDLYTIQDYYKNGKLKMIGKSSSRYYYPKLSGACIEFFPNGKRKSVKNYLDGKLTGDVVEYFPSGKSYITGSYNNDGKLTINSCSDSTGKLLVENGNGHCVKYDGDFKRIYAEGNIVDGLEEGEWHGILDNSANYVCTYEKGVSKGGVAYDKDGKRYTFTTTEIIEPQFKRGIEAFYNFLGRNVHYPSVAKENNIQGKVFISFVIEKDGVLTNVHVLRGIGSGCDEESARVIKLSPPWLPGMQYGMPVRVLYNVPITFTLTVDNH